MKKRFFAMKKTTIVLMAFSIILIGINVFLTVLGFGYSVNEAKGVAVFLWIILVPFVIALVFIFPIVEISEKGIALKYVISKKSRFLKWDDLVEVEIMRIGPTNGFYFYKSQMTLEEKMSTTDAFTFSYSKRALKEIQKYYAKPIKNADITEYLNKNTNN